jgi:hypothetical protein
MPRLGVPGLGILRDQRDNRRRVLSIAATLHTLAVQCKDDRTLETIRRFLERKIDSIADIRASPVERRKHQQVEKEAYPRSSPPVWKN